MNAKLTILKKGLILVAIPLVIQLGFLVLMVKSRSELLNAQKWAIHTKDVIGKAESIYRRLTEAQGAIGGLILTGDLAAYEPFEQSLSAVPQGLEDLRELVKDNPPQQVKVGSLAQSMAALSARQLETARLYREAKIDEARERVKATMTEGMLLGLRTTINDFLNEEERLDRERTTALERSSRRQSLAMLVGGGFALAVTVVLSWTFSRGITRRVAVLAENARRLAEAKELATPLTGRDEFAELDRVFHWMAKALEEKDRENELFIYSVSHDLRSPLVNLQGFSEELGYAGKELRAIFQDESVPEPLRKKGLRLVEREVDDSIHFIQTAVSRLSVIIDALLRLSRAGRVEYRYQSVDVDLAVRRVIESLGSTINGRQAKVTASPLPATWGDPTAVEQIFANLVGNAVNYLDPSRPGVVEVGAIDPDPLSNGTWHATYYIKDNGLGIPESGKPKLFLAFQRFHDGGARGEGIGLALVRKIVERHGGKIRVESTSGVGSTFFVDLPIGPPQGTLASQPTSRVSSQG